MTIIAAAAAGRATKPVRRSRRRSVSRWSGTGRTPALSAAPGAGSRPGAAPSLAMVQTRSAAPAANAVASSQTTALDGTQSTHSGATTNSPIRTASAPTIVQRRSSGPDGPVSADSGPSRTAPNSSAATSRAAKTAATAKAMPR